MKNEKGRDEILRLVRTVRRRWRLAVLLRGLAVALGLTVGVLFLSSLALEWLRFSPQAVLWLRVVTWGTLLLSLASFILLPLRRSVTDRQVALYLEEHEPSLDHAIVSAFELGSTPGVSPGLGRRLVETAVQRAQGVAFGRRVEQPRLYRLGGLLTALAVASLVFMLLGPAHLRHGLSALLVPTRDAAAVNPYAVSVSPGDITIARGTDQLVTAGLEGFESDAASVFVRSSPDAPFQRLSMLPGQEGGFEVLLLAVSERTEYFVESTGIRSATYAIDVADLPYVDRVDLTYHFPSYTGLPPRVVEDGGDVVALPGTVVEIRVTPTIPTPEGRLVLDGDAGTDLGAEDDGTRVGEIRVLPDLDPSVRFTRPGRDTPASPIEEVYLEVRADDDYGVGDVRLVFSVNGGPEDTVAMFEGSGAPLKEISTGHTMFLEEWELEPGDLISYYGLVRDNRSRRGGKAVASDMYFINVRPFERTYRQGEQQGGAPQGGGAQGAESALSEMQRQIISATFNLIRQQDSYAAGEFSENVVSVALAQARLIDQVEALLQRMVNRGLTETDEGFRDISAILPRAAEAMRTAQERLDAEELREAIPDEQTALRYLQQAEETYERYVVQQQSQQGGGGGGGQAAAAEDLADLFELELDKLENQYETVRRGQQETADNEVDEVLERLKELSRRLEQAAERQRRRAQQGAQGSSSGSSDAQREMADEAEEAARQLQRLARETGQNQLEETARQLQQAAESMRQAAAQRGAAGLAEANSALDRLDEAQRRLQQAQDDRARREAEEALERVDELARQQREMQRDVRELPTDRGPERSDRIDLLRERKDQMTEAVSEVERELDRASSVASGEQPEAARKLKAAAEQIRESKLKEKLQFSRGTIEQWDPESAVTMELNIEADLQALRDRLEDAAAVAGERQVDPLEEALEETRELVRGMEALDRRLRSPTGQDPGDRQAGEGEQQGNDPEGEAQQGEQGQQGQEAGQQQGQQGQAGQQQGQQGGRQAEGQAGGPGGAADARPDRPTDVQGDVSSLSGGATRGDPRRLSPDEVRQFRREILERGDQVRNLQARLDQAGMDAADLRAVIQAMGRLQRNGIYDNPTQVALLQDEILDALKRLEFGLRRQVEGASDGPASLAGSGDVPDEYRRLVEEYYRKLAASGRGGGSGR
jgi:cytochrome c biogenesis protein CcdA